MTLFLFVINPLLSPHGSIKVWGGYLFRSIPSVLDPRSNSHKTWIQLRGGELGLKVVRSHCSQIWKTKVWPVQMKRYFLARFRNNKRFLKTWRHGPSGVCDECVPVLSSVERVETLISCRSSSVSVWKRRMEEPSENAIHTPPPAHAMCATLIIGSGWTSNFCNGNSNGL